jgi:hypothetical protein
VGEVYANESSQLSYLQALTAKKFRSRYDGVIHEIGCVGPIPRRLAYIYNCKIKYGGTDYQPTPSFRTLAPSAFWN